MSADKPAGSMAQRSSGYHLPKLRGLEVGGTDPTCGPEAIGNTLEGAVRRLPASGAALLRPQHGIASPWLVDYAGSRRGQMGRWLRERLEPSLEASARNLAARAPCSADPALVLTLRREGIAAGLCVLWLREDVGTVTGLGEGVEGVRETLEVFLEVEHGEATYFGGAAGSLDTELAGALGRGDSQALPALLSLVRTVGGADIAYWGSVRGEAVEVERHLGARDGGFGFRLPLGEGVGGRAFAVGSTVEIPDYRNCQYRYPVVSDVTDGEEVRSTLAIPVRGSSGGGAVLYAARRSVEPFTPAQRILLKRVARSIEPVPGLPPAPRLFTTTQDIDHARLGRAELRKLLVESNRALDVEAWLERTIGGPAVLVDANDRPYAAGRLPSLQHLASPRKAEETCLELSLGRAGGAGERGRLRLRPSVQLPPEGWKDFFEDVVTACNVVLDRMEQTHDRINRRRSLWLGEVAEGRGGRDARRDGNRLGLPVEKGEVWAVSWEPGDKTAAESARLAMLAEDLVLDLLGDPLVALDEGVGVVLLRERARGRRREKPSTVRDALLRYVGPGPLWLVHGVAYESFGDLREALNQAVGVAKRLREAGSEPFVSEVDSCGLDGLLENSRISEELAAFANRMLKPLLDHDAGGNSKLTETFCLTLTLGSPTRAARRLYVHENTVRYRMGRAQKLLGRDLSLPKEHTALTLAAFSWLRAASPDASSGAPHP